LVDIYCAKKANRGHFEKCPLRDHIGHLETTKLSSGKKIVVNYLARGALSLYFYDTKVGKYRGPKHIYNVALEHGYMYLDGT